MSFHACLLITLMASPALPDQAALARLNARLAPTDITVDLSALPPTEKVALAKLVEASRLIDALFLRQVWSGNEALLLQLARDESALGRARMQAFLLHKGPWDRIDHELAFLPGVPAQRPPQGNFYPAGATKEAVEKWIASLSKEEAAAARGFFTTVRRDPQGKLTSVPYSVEYQGELEAISRLLREAAALSTQPSLKKFLTLRADALLSNDYYASDVAWMQLDASIEPTLGPYETYEDGWFNAKASFESFITLRDDAETAKLAKFAAELQGIENQLPIDPKWRNPKLGALSPIRVVNSVYASGDADRGVQTAAFNLPNDEKIAQEMGTKKTMLRNITQAKFEKVLRPIAEVALSPADRARVSFDAFFTHILMHELMHGLGPHETLGAAQKQTLRAALQEHYSAIEEAKADISGLWALQLLIDGGKLDRSLEQSLYVTFLASSFRTLRFGLNEAHAKGQAIQLNFLLDQGAVKVAPDGTFMVDSSKVKGAVKALTSELLTLQAKGDKAGVQRLLAKGAVLRPEVKKVLAKLESVPVDIAPRYRTAAAL
jgi:hypothetical protein